ncbi:pseudouridine synthase family protein [Mycoplasma miroungirhinis]|uniref:RNA pseudouridylate synthase n=1 Tax=Mycoplasma miroungirhinis TaxID=754516 RepID=A0A6M4JG66_9MOLU|nr:RluA family pseudouridine synthase [Mycoplasma miroungirhinis]QJR44032.1 RluA family pseudouridine synthase [Mycoplasma miroungirhinis]
MKQFKATKNDQGRSLFKFIIKRADNVPISKIEKVFRKKDIKVNNIRTNDKQYKIQENDVVTIYGIEDTTKDNENIFNKANITFKKVYEDDDILIVDKKAGIAMSNELNCLNDQVLTYLKFQKTDSFIPDSIGRLDKVTSGLVIYAKNYATLVEFKQKQENFIKIYQFLSDINQNKVVTVKLIKDVEKQKMKVSNDKQGTKAITRFFVENNKKYAEIKTGKKHQIRATLEYLGFPILGDTKYGAKKSHRVFLHSYSITIRNLDKKWDHLNDQQFISYPKW